MNQNIKHLGLWDQHYIQILILSFAQILIFTVYDVCECVFSDLIHSDRTHITQDYIGFHHYTYLFIFLHDITNDFEHPNSQETVEETVTTSVHHTLSEHGPVCEVKYQTPTGATGTS